ncbi:hypothetical protein [Chitinophaga solisilvae]|uniref:hypothetical protein n=1 Tax=Chitinophaga solisilvae TaxID=1233460 RepID=UPI00137033C4|nr:hypothetical protein [Chitinophaga solisilvae]
MRKIFYLALAVTLVACDQKGRKSRFGNEDGTATADAPKKNTDHKTGKTTAGAPVIGERVAANTQVRIAPDGDIAATLLDYIPVHAAPQKKGWYPVSIDIDITPEEYTKPVFRKGRKLKVNGLAAGVLERDMRLPVATNGEKMWATLNGYTEKKNIRNGTIIETALVNFLKQHKGRSLADIQPFIRNFQLEEEKSLKPYTLFFNYESGIDDPSPMYRVALVCQGDELIGVVHSRPMQIEGSTPKKMQRDFTVHFMKDIDKSLREDFCKKFNQFILAAD